jgi:oxygen-dependent protoporphyrinogen oxidase
MRRRIAIVGAGIAGLSLAHALGRRGARERGTDVVVLEAAARVGGNIRTEWIDGFLCEWGPNGFLDSVPATLDLVRDLGLQDRLHASDDSARKRYIYRNGRLHLLPEGPGDFLRSRLLSWPGKLRIAGEPWARRRPDTDESIHAFASRRIGREAADVLIDSMVSGVFGGDARRLSLRACFPKMWEMETEHGGLFRALLAKRRARKLLGGPVGAPAGRLTSFRHGTVELTDELARQLGSALKLGAPVERITRHGTYRIDIAGAGSMEADQVVLAGGAGSSASIVRPLDAELAGVLDEIPSAPMAVVCLGYDQARLPRPLDGFGFLAPRGEGQRILGALWDSSIYPGRAPRDAALVRVMLGGAHDPEAAALDEGTLVDIAMRGLADTMGIRAEPVFRRVFRHRIGIPQYTIGHLDRLARIDARLAKHPGLAVAGNAFRGVAINTCVAEAGPIADRLLTEPGPLSSTRS